MQPDVQEINNKVIRLETREQYTNKSLANVELHIEELRRVTEKNGLASEETNAGITAISKTLDSIQVANTEHSKEHKEINDRLKTLESAPDKKDAGKWRKWEDQLQRGISWTVALFVVGKVLSWLANNVLKV